jgi:ferric-dicitrate binding protein FerR (iron transport regulator)
MTKAKEASPVFSIEPNYRKNKWKIHYAAAAIIICIISISTYYLLKPEHSTQISKTGNIKIIHQNDLAPGANKAVLTLANGASIILDSAQNGALTTQGNTKILKLNGMLTYEDSSKASSAVLYNTISTPRGGQYQLVLADGSKVWLNAASSLRFPAAFTGKERKVELMGEGYFEVAKNASMPFKVEVNGMEVEVLGTHFNINSYHDEPAIRTTLLEGSVKINKNNTTSLLKPGQQAEVNSAGEVRIINDADIDAAVAWKDGKFQFDRADIYAIMRQIARWYDVDVEYKGATIISHFGGTISRNVNLSQVLKMLHLTGEVKFEINGRKIMVMPEPNWKIINKNN